MSNSFNLYKNTKIFKGLDGIRFVSIAAVVWHHAVGHVDGLWVTRFGFLGVDLFFVISGFLIVTLLLREKEKTGHISLKLFYIRRSLRIFPLYYGFILGLAALYYFFNSSSEFGIRLINELPYYLFYLGNFYPVGLGIVWSLATEEQFYLVWPFIEKYLEKFITPLLTIFLIINQIINFKRSEIASFFDMPVLNELSIMQSTFTPILIGVLIAHLLHKEKTYIISKLVSSSFASLIIITLLIVLLSFAPQDISGITRLTVHLLMGLLVISVVTNKNSNLISFFSFTPIARIGTISYGIYLFHIHAIIVCTAVLAKLTITDPIAIFISSFLLAILAAELSYRFFESPFLKLKSRFGTPR